MKLMIFAGFLILNSLLAVTSCSAQRLEHAPTDRFLKGPFLINTDWQTLRFEKPLKTFPLVQGLDIDIDSEQYTNIDIPENNYRAIDSTFIGNTDKSELKLEVILSWVKEPYIS